MPDDSMDVIRLWDQRRGAGPKPPEPFVVLDPRKWTEPAPPRRWLVPEWIPRGVVTALYGDGGMGKSLLAQQLMASTAIGRPWLGLPTTPGRALGIMCEDDADELHRRQDAINAQMGLGAASWDRLRLVSRLGMDNVLMSFDGCDVGTPTATFELLDKLCAAEKPDLLVCDTIADFFGGNENNRSQVRQFVQNTFGRLARDHACAVVVCGHPSASGISNGSGTGGSTAWNNTVRSRMYLTKPEGEDASPDARVLSRKKANYAARDADVPLLWDAGAFRPVLATSDLPDWPTIGRMLDMVTTGWLDGNPYSMAVQTRETGRYFPAVCSKRFGVPQPVAQRLMAEWLNAGHVEVATISTHSKIRGLKVTHRFDRERNK